MLTITCKLCGEKIIWDDFAPTAIRCPKCRETITLHDSLRANIDHREQGEAALVKRCPACGAVIKRLWFISCDACDRWIFGKRSLNGKWFTAFVFFILYVVFSTLYVVYLR